MMCLLGLFLPYLIRAKVHSLFLTAPLSPIGISSGLSVFFVLSNSSLHYCFAQCQFRILPLHKHTRFLHINLRKKRFILAFKTFPDPCLCSMSNFSASYPLLQPGWSLFFWCVPSSPPVLSHCLSISPSRMPFFPSPLPHQPSRSTPAFSSLL